jgi:hypothetical protein
MLERICWMISVRIFETGCALKEHQVDVGTTIAIATAPAPSSATKAFVRHALKSELNAAHI